MAVDGSSSIINLVTSALNNTFYLCDNTLGTGSLPGVKRPGRGADHPPPSNRRVHDLYSPSGPLWSLIGGTVTLLYDNTSWKLNVKKIKFVFHNVKYSRCGIFYIMKMSKDFQSAVHFNDYHCLYTWKNVIPSTVFVVLYIYIYL